MTETRTLTLAPVSDVVGGSVHARWNRQTAAKASEVSSTPTDVDENRTRDPEIRML